MLEIKARDGTIGAKLDEGFTKNIAPHTAKALYVKSRSNLTTQELLIKAAQEKRDRKKKKRNVLAQQFIGLVGEAK